MYREDVPGDPVSPPSWTVLQRDVSSSLSVPGEERALLTVIIDTTTGQLLTARVGGDESSSLLEAIHSVLRGGAELAPQRPPRRILCGPPLSRRMQLLGAVFEPEHPVHVAERWATDDDEEFLDTLVADLAGRRPPPQRPSADDRLLLVRAARRFLDSRLWEEWRHDELLACELQMDGRGTQAVASAFGGVSDQAGLLISPAWRIPAAGYRPQPGRMPPGSVALNLTSRVPADVVVQARRYGWPEAERWLPFVFVFEEEGLPRAPDSAEVQLLTVAIPAVLEHCRRRSQADNADELTTTGTVPLAGGVKGRYVAWSFPKAEVPLLQ